MSKVEELEKLKGKIEALEVEIQGYETELGAIMVNDTDDAATKKRKDKNIDRLSNLITASRGNLDRLYDKLLLEGAMAANQFAGAHTGWRVCFVCPLSLFYLSCWYSKVRGSEQICGRPLGAHPRERDINPAPAPMPPTGEPQIIWIQSIDVDFTTHVQFCRYRLCCWG
jgi:hypothetical protein